MRKESSCGVKKIRFETEMFRVNLASRFWSSLVFFGLLFYIAFAAWSATFFFATYCDDDG